MKFLRAFSAKKGRLDRRQDLKLRFELLRIRYSFGDNWIAFANAIFLLISKLMLNFEVNFQKRWVDFRVIALKKVMFRRHNILKFILLLEIKQILSEEMTENLKTVSSFRLHLIKLNHFINNIRYSLRKR